MTEIVEVNRARIRLEGLSSYATIAALIMNSALRIFTTVPVSHHPDRVERAIAVLVLLASTVSIIAGSYTTVVFTLIGLYGKAALGRQQDAAYLAFFSQTVYYRQVAFKTFILCLSSFSASLCLDLLLKLKGRWRWVAFTACSLATCVMLRQWLQVIAIGYQLVFNSGK